MKKGSLKVDKDAQSPRKSAKRAAGAVKKGSSPGVKVNWPYTTPPGRHANIKGC